LIEEMFSASRIGDSLSVIVVGPVGARDSSVKVEILDL